MAEGVIIGTAGHIDHGKTALVRALTGVDTDRTPDEKRRGITIELGFAPLTLGDTAASIIDVPGHEAFVRTMVAGAVGIDLALLVVAADDGLRPQTHEHLAIVQLLGVQGMVVALTKCDRADPARVASVAADLHALLRATAFADAPIIPVSTVTGYGMPELRDALRTRSEAIRQRAVDVPVRLPIDRVLTAPGVGTVVTGSLWSGVVAPGDVLRVAPSEHAVRVRGVQRHGEAVSHGRAGERLALAVAGIERDELARGDLLLGGEGWTETTVFRADVTVLPASEVALTPRTRVRVHVGTRDIGGRVVATGGVPANGVAVAARVVLDEPVVVRGGDRFVLRRPSPPATIGGGVVTDAAPSEARVRPFPRPAMSVDARIQFVLAEAGLRGCDAATLPTRLGLSGEETVMMHTAARLVGDCLYAPAELEAVSTRLRDWLRSWHVTQPSSVGAPLSEASRATRVPAPLVRPLLAADPLVTVDGATVRLSGFVARRDAVRDAAAAAVVSTLQQAGFEMPSSKELEPVHGASVPTVLRALAGDQEVVLVGHDRWSTPSVVQALAARLVQELTPLRDYTASELRVVFGVSRKYLIPWLEFCDREGLTLRHGDVRRLGARAQRVAQGLS